MSEGSYSLAAASTWLEQSVLVAQPRTLRRLDAIGEDARGWLNGQVTADLRHTGSARASYSLALNIKGRILADLWVTAMGEGEALRMCMSVDESALAALCESFEAHIIMEDVELSPRSDLRLVALLGPAAKEIADRLQDTLGDAVIERCATARMGQACAAGGVDLWVSEAMLPAALASAEALASEFDGGALPQQDWAALHMRHALPLFPLDFGPQSYPQEAGLQRRAVSFEKGCYLGQEVVCMLENRGQLSRQLVLLESLPPDTAGQPGDKLLDPAGKRVGEITRAEMLEDGGCRALAYLKPGFVAKGSRVQRGGHPWQTLTIIGDGSQSPP